VLNVSRNKKGVDAKRMVNKSESIDNDFLNKIFRLARSQNQWRDAPVAEGLLKEVYDLAKLGPTSANSSPARFLFITSAAGRSRLKAHLSPGNVEKTMSAPCTVIVASDPKYYEKMPFLFPHAPGFGKMFESLPDKGAEHALRNGSLQGAYLIIAARALGLDCGPMSGFDSHGVDAEFFSGTGWRSNFLVNLGYGDPAGVAPRLPRLDFEEACEVV